MKKYLVYPLTLALALGVLYGCRSAGTGNTAAGESASAEQAASEASSEAPAGGGEEASGEAPAEGGETITITDAFGEVEVPLHPTVVVSLDNRTFETLSDWGITLAAAPKAVMPADSPYVTDDSVQDIGNHREPNLEVIAAVNPELVIVGQRFAGYYEDIKALVPDAAVISLNIDVSEESEHPGDALVNGLKDHTRTLGAIFGKEDEAEALIAEFDAAVAAAGEGYDPAKTVMAVNVSGGEIGYVAPLFGRVWGPWYEVFGWTPALDVGNASSDHQGDEVSIEAIAQSNPDYIMVLDRDAAVSADSAPAKDVIENAAALQNVTAVTEGNIVYAPSDTYVNEGIQTYIELLQSLAEVF